LRVLVGCGEAEFSALALRRSKSLERHQVEVYPVLE
jgi:hypothetical protein